MDRPWTSSWTEPCAFWRFLRRTALPATDPANRICRRSTSSSRRWVLSWHSWFPETILASQIYINHIHLVPEKLYHFYFCNVFGFCWFSTVFSTVSAHIWNKYYHPILTSLRRLRTVGCCFAKTRSVTFSNWERCHCGFCRFWYLFIHFLWELMPFGRVSAGQYNCTSQFTLVKLKLLC